MFEILSTYICWKKYIKCYIWRVAVSQSYIEDARFLKVKETENTTKGVHIIQTPKLCIETLSKCFRQQEIYRDIIKY